MRGGGDDDHRNPSNQRKRDRAHVADRVLQIAEGEGAERRRDVDDQDQHDRALGGELHHLLGVDRGERHHRRDAGLVEQHAKQEPAQVAVFARVLESVPDSLPRVFGGGLRDCPLAQEQERRRRRHREKARRDQHRHRDEQRRRLPAALRGGDVGEADAERSEPAQVAEAPAPARDAAHGLRVGELRQERRDEVLAAAEEVVGQDDQAEREPDRARRGKPEQRREHHAADRREQQQLLLGGVRVGPGADQRAGDEDGRVGDRQGSRPRERGPGSVLGNNRDKISAEDGGNDDGGVAGVGEVVHAPRPDFMQFDLRRERRAHGAF